MDRDEILGSDRIGYRSVHFVCELGTRRANLPEYDGLNGLKFEIQLRTVLQHAWAELAHDRSFKLGLDLPKAIQRKLNLHAGMLEVIDSAFDDIANEIDNYRSSLNRKNINDMDDVELNSISLEKFLNEIASIYSIGFKNGDITDDVVRELRSFGVSTIGDLKSIATRDLIAEIQTNKRIQTRVGFLRDVMMFENLEKYFLCSPNWGLIGLNDAKMFADKYGAEKIANLFCEHGISVNDGEEEDEGEDYNSYPEILNALKTNVQDH